MGAESVNGCTYTEKSESSMRTLDDRWLDWFNTAKERAESMMQLAALAENRPRRKRAAGGPEVGAVESWFEPERLGRVVIQDPPNFIENWAARKAKPTTYFRSFHGKDKAA